MADAIESLIIEPILEDMVLAIGPGVRVFMSRSGYALPADSQGYIFRPLHRGDFESGLMYDARGRKLEASYGFTVMGDCILIDQAVTFPLEFAYMLIAEVDTTAPPFTWPLPGTQPGQGGWGLHPNSPTIAPGINGGTWTIPGNGAVWTIDGTSTMGPSTGSYGVYYSAYSATNGSAQGLAQNSGSISLTMNPSAPSTLADFAALRASGTTVTDKALSSWH